MTTLTGSTEARFLDIHVLLSTPYANLNRDDTGSPKTCHLGGVERARVSSQCQKRAARLVMSHRQDIQTAVRTRKLPDNIAEALVGLGWDYGHALLAANGVLATHGFETYKDNPAETSIITFLPDDAGHRTAELIEEHRNAIIAAIDALATADVLADPEADKKKFGEASKHFGNVLKSSKPPAKANKAVKDSHRILTDRLSQADRKELLNDVKQEICRRNPVIALMGRMLTALPDSNVDGAAQVAHAFSTHAADIDTDYFTAVDDLNPAVEPGAGMIGTVDHVSAVFYKRAVVDLCDLRENLTGHTEDVTPATAAAFADAFAKTVSEAKKTTTGPPPRPSLVLVVARSDTPVSYCNAFECPVQADVGGGYLAPSAKRLLEEASDDKEDPGITGAWLYLAQGVIRDLHSDADITGGLFPHATVTLHTLEDAIHEGLSS